MSEPNKHGGRNLNFLFLVGLVLAILTIVFAIQNADTVAIEFFSFSVDAHKALLIMSCILIGSVLTLLFSIPAWYRRRKTIATLRGELDKLRRNYEELAAIQRPEKH